MHYAPPGAQILLTNPLFVRSHDFIGVQGAKQTWGHTDVFGTGWPANAGGRLVDRWRRCRTRWPKRSRIS